MQGEERRLIYENKFKSSHILEDLVYPFGGVTDLKLIMGVAGLIPFLSTRLHMIEKWTNKLLTNIKD